MNTHGTDARIQWEARTQQLLLMHYWCMEPCYRLCRMNGFLSLTGIVFNNLCYLSVPRNSQKFQKFVIYDRKHKCISSLHMPLNIYSQCCNLHYHTSPRVSVNKIIQFCNILSFSKSSKYPYPDEYHIHVWHVWLQLSFCGTWQIWMWFK